jgi:hypothetical protein
MIDQQAFTRQLAEYVQGEAAKIVDEEAAAASKRVEARVKATCALAAVTVLEHTDFRRMGTEITIHVDAEEFVQALQRKADGK